MGLCLRQCLSHSIFLTALLASMMAMLLLLPKFKEQVGTKVVLAWSITWLGHMVLDAMYSHGNGIGIFWPFSDAHLILHVSWFDTISWPPISEHNRRVFAIETAVYGTVLAMCIAARRIHHVSAK